MARWSSWCAGRPAWYELDQPLAIEVEEVPWFCENEPPGVPAGFDLVFHNPLLDRAEPCSRRLLIRGIKHASLGEVRRVDTTGLIYVFELVSGLVIRVEAEETPGVIEPDPATHGLTVANWDLEVTLVS